MTTKTEPSLALAAAPPAGVDKYGFPVVTCPKCLGRGMHGYNAVDGDRCYGCGGTGHQYAPEVLRDVVAEFAAAQRAAARPRVRDLRVGDIVSKPYIQLREVSFRKVARVLVAPQKPTRFEVRGQAKKPVAFAAAIEFEDGTRDIVTTDFVYARRGAEVDPAPYVRRAVRKGRSAPAGPLRKSA